MTRIIKRFDGRLEPEKKTHIVLIHKLKNEQWEAVPNTKTLVVPKGPLEIIAAVDFESIVRAYNENEHLPFPEPAKPFLFYNIGNRHDPQGVTHTDYFFYGVRPITTAEKPLIEYHIFETTAKKTEWWVGSCAYIREDGTLNPVVFKHIRYVKKR